MIWIVANILCILVPASVIYHFYYKSTSFGRYSAIRRTLLIVLSSTFSLDIVAPIFILIDVYSMYWIIGIKFYMLVVAMPFVYWASAHWDAAESNDYQKANFLQNQIIGIVLGFAAGFIFLIIPQKDYIFYYPGMFTSLSGWLIMVPKII